MKISLKHLQETAINTRRLQNPDGGFSWHQGDPSTLGATSTAIRILNYLNDTVTDLFTCISFIDSCRKKLTAGFKDGPNSTEESFTETAQGLVALAELGLPRDQWTEMTVEHFISQTQSDDKIRIAAAVLSRLNITKPISQEWTNSLLSKLSEASVKDDAVKLTGTVDALFNLGSKPDNLDDVFTTVKEQQNIDGGWGFDRGTSDVYATYIVMRGCYSMKRMPDKSIVQKFIDNCRKDDGIYALTADGKGELHGTYFALYISKLLDQQGG